MTAEPEQVDQSWRDAIGCAPATPGSISPEQAVRNARNGVVESVDLSTAKVGQSAEIRSEPPASSSNSSEIPNSSPDSPVARYACGSEVRAHEYQEIHDLCIEIARLKEKNRELNRRAQSADAAATDAKRCLDALAAGTENGTPWCGGSVGRMLLAWHVRKQYEQIERLTAERDKLVGLLKEYRRYEHIEGHRKDGGRDWWGPRYKMPEPWLEVSNESGHTDADFAALLPAGEADN